MEGFKFASVCDGIGCGRLGFERAGFDTAWTAEIEAFPNAVTALRFEPRRNIGNMKKAVGKLRRGYVEAPDVLIGGTPCQAFSVAGQRKGLEDARGNLSLEFCRVADAIDAVRGRDGKQPCVVLWENVPGVLSDKGNAFGCFLGELAGSGCQLRPPGGRWRNAGCVFGPKRTVAWRVLDSQWFGVAQRRRRVFVVASAGDRTRPEEILFEREGVRRDSPPSRAKGEGVTYDVAPCLGASGRGVERTGETRGQDPVVAVQECVGTLSPGAHPGDCNGQDAYNDILVVAHGQANAEVALNQAPTLNCNHEAPIVTYDMRGNGDGETVGTLTGDHAGRPTDYTPVVCSAEIVGPLVSGHSPNGHGCAGVNSQAVEAGHVIAIQERACAPNINCGPGGKDYGNGAAENLSPTLRAMEGEKPNGGGQMAVAFERRFVRTSGGQPTIYLQPCLRADANTGDGAPCVAYGFTTKESGKDAAADIIPPLRAESGDPHMGGRMAVAFGGDIARTLSAPHDSSPCVDRGMDVVATGMQVRRLTPCECEALQGLPRNWTHIPWRGKPAEECPDGPRYKAVGNGQTVQVMEWLAGRIMKALVAR